MAPKKQGKEAKTVRRDRQSALVELHAEWDRRLASLQAPDTAARVDAAFAAKGKIKTRSKAGPSF
ncbi:MAG: hypothetical protein KGI43_00945 [Alphaproteobacteria bacterium]|nr:hypothetical protein [Alphaproteobacteria bacterium]